MIKNIVVVSFVYTRQRLSLQSPNKLSKIYNRRPCVRVVSFACVHQQILIFSHKKMPEILDSSWIYEYRTCNGTGQV